MLYYRLRFLYNEEVRENMRRKTIFKEAGVLLITSLMILSAIIVTANTKYDVAVKENDSAGISGPQSEFIANFMTPDGDPYPFDVIISDGEYVQEFNNVTYIDANVSTNITLSLVYFGYHFSNMYECRLSLAPYKIYEFEFYALNESSVLGRVQPYLSGKEIGTTVNLTWHYFTNNNTLIYNVKTDPLQKYVFVTTWTQAATDYGRRTVEQFVKLSSYVNGRYDIISWCKNGQDTAIDKLTGETVHTHHSVEPIFQDSSHPSGITAINQYAEVSAEFKPIGIRKALDNSFWLKNYEVTLSPVDGASIAPQYHYPQWVVPTNSSHFFEINNLSATYANLRIPIFASDKADNIVFDLYPPRIAEIEPYTFSIAGQNFFAESSYSNLRHNSSVKMITVDVSTKVNSDWWGCFVLPKTFAVDTLTAYVNGTPSELSLWTDYLINRVADYNFVVVRITPNVTSFKLDYVEDSTPPVLEKVEPRGIYFANKRIIPLPINFALVIGKVTLSATATDNESAVGCIEFYIDNQLRCRGIESNYSCLWTEKSYGMHTFKIVAYDNAENIVSQEIKVWKFF
jgi:hypothetical protein